MEFREYYRGICARIRFDAQTGIYTGELEGLPGETFQQTTSYEDLQAAMKQSVDDYLAGRKTDLGKSWPSAVKLEQKEVGKEAGDLEDEMARIAAEMFKTTD